MLITHHHQRTDESVVVDGAKNCQENFTDIFGFFPRETTRCDEARFLNHARRRASGWWRDVSDRGWPERRWSLLLIVEALFRDRRAPCHS